MKRVLGIAMLVIVCGAAEALAQTQVFIVRHAEKADVTGKTGMMASDPDLSEAGRARAEKLAAMLKDARITTVLVTQYKRTAQTAEPTARAFGVEMEKVHSDDIAGMAQKARASKGNVLIVSHSGSTPKTLRALGVGEGIEIPESEYDNLFIVTLTETPSLVRLRFH